jgi:LPXTG-site transpeptidase (sortase) family protein
VSSPEDRALSARSRAFSKIVEAVAWATAIVCLAYVGVRHVDSVNSNRESMRRFTELTTAEHRHGSVDVTLWSEARIKAWQSTRDLSSPTPLAILRIPRIRLEVPVLKGTDELTLNRAVGHIEDTAMPGVDGNAGIAGHRDGFFRGLMNLVAGDAIELESLHGTESYRIERTWIVNPDDVSVLDPTPGRSLTLVTCYPFYFVGSAPQRYIVRAVRVDTWWDARTAYRLLGPPAITPNK